MFIEKLELKNFRSHQHTKFEFARVNVIRGQHAQGKSSIALGIEFMLTNQCGVTDAGGRGADQLLLHGADEFMVRGKIGLSDDRKKPGAVIARSRNKAGGNLMIGVSTGKVKNLVAKNAESWIEEKLAPRPVLSAVLNAQRFLQMPEKDRKQLLTMALAADPVELPTEIREALGKFVDEAPTHIDGPSDADFYYDTLYKRRREVNSLLNDMGALEPPAKPQGMPSAGEVKDKISGLRKELNALLNAMSSHVAQFQSHKTNLQRAHLDSKEYTPQILDEKEMERLNKQAGCKQAAATLDLEIAQKLFSIRQLGDEIAQLKEDPGNCPTCGQSRPRRDTSEQINNTQHRLEIARRDLDDLKKKREPLGNPAEAEQKLAAHRKAIPKAAAAEKTIAELDGITDTVDTQEWDEKIAPLNDRISKGEAVLEQINKFEGETAGYEREKKQRDELTTKVGTLQMLIDYFGANGELRPKLVGDKLGGFLAAVNVVLKRFGFYAEINLEPFSVRVTYLRGDKPEPSWQPLDLGQLSESEAFRFGVAFQISLAEATGVNMVVIDRADLLLPGTQRFLNAALMDSKLDQAFILAAKEDLELKQLPPDGVRIFDLKKDEHGHTQIGAVHEAENREVEYVKD
jgi:hypothetical protein